MSQDPPETHARFREAHGLPFPLAADVDKAIAKLYGVKRRWGVPIKRVTFLIDKQGVIREVFHHELAIGRHRDEVLEGLRRLEEAGR